jgi:hypothetical protein
MFLDIRVTLATFVTAVGLALVMAAVGTRAWVGQDRFAPPHIEARAPAVADPIEQGFAAVSPASARMVDAPAAPAAIPASPTPASVQSFLAAPKAEPARAAERVSPPPVSVNAMPGAVVQERFDVLHEPSGQVVPPARAISAGVGGPLVPPLPRPRAGESAATQASVAGSEQGAEQAPPRPKATVAVRRTEASAAKKRTRQTSGYFGGLFGR